VSGSAKTAPRLRRHAGMAICQVEDFAAFEFAVRFKLAVYRLIEDSRGASRNFKYRQQLQDAASGIEGAMSEGFGRRRPREFALYLRYSLGSLNEARTRLRDGIDRNYFSESACREAFTWAERCKAATQALWRSQLRKAASDDRRTREVNRLSRTKPESSARTPRSSRSD
jgi:four helix bundle protein